MPIPLEDMFPLFQPTVLPPPSLPLPYTSYVACGTFFSSRAAAARAARFPAEIKDQSLRLDYTQKFQIF